jgi:hypothetical protein
MTPTVSGLSQLDEPPGPHHAEKEAPNASESQYANPRDYANLTQSTSLRIGVNKTMTRFGVVPCNALAFRGHVFAFFHASDPVSADQMRLFE